MSAIKRAMCDALVAHLAARPELAGIHVSAPQADYEDAIAYPHIVVVPQKLDFNVWQEDEVDESVAGQLLIHLGDFEGSVEIRCGALTPFEREGLEEKVWAVFMERELAPGVLVLTAPPISVSGIQYALEPVIAFALADDSWNEEMVFDAPRYSYLTLDAAFPALASRGAYTIDRLILAFTTDLDSNTPDESRQVAGDGSTVTL